jgi:hypothetical protein
MQTGCAALWCLAATTAGADGGPKRVGEPVQIVGGATDYRHSRVGTRRPAPPLPSGKLRYLRPAGERWTHECTFTIATRDNGWSIASVTERGKLTLSVGTAYDADDRLASAVVELRQGDKKSMATATADDRVVRIQQPEQPPKTVEAPGGVIVTSAPDWTDILLLCARYDYVRDGKQQFPGLWIHPRQPIQSLTFTIERTGHDVIRHGDRQVKLSRFVIHLRGQSAYAAWADETKKLIRLMPLPAKEPRRTGLVLEGFEESGATALRP